MQTNFTLAQLADPETARSEHILRKCVHCGFCTATCPTFLLLGDERDSPRGRIELIKAMLEDGGAPSAETVIHVDRCLSCLACNTTCPSGVDYAQLNFTTSAAAKFVKDCQAQGYNPTWGTSAQSIGSDYLGLKNFTAFGPAYAFPAAGESDAVATFTKAMGSYAKGDNWKEGAASFDWTGLVAIQKALASVSAGATVTAQDVATGLESFKDETLDGMAPPLNYVAGKANPVDCWYLVVLKDGQYSTPYGTDSTCVSK